MNLLKDQWLIWIAMVTSAVTALVVAILAPERFRAALARLWRFAPVLALVALIVVFGWYLPTRYDSSTRLAQTAVPGYFQSQYWRWLLAMGLGLIVCAVWLWWTFQSIRSNWMTGGPLDAVWSAIITRIGVQGRRVQVLLAPNPQGEERAAALVHGSGLRVAAEAPIGPSPLHAQAITDGIILTCNGNWTQGERPDRAEDLARKLRAASSGRPTVSGLVAVFPVDWISDPTAVDVVAAAWEEIQAFYEALGERCSVFALFPGLESIPGARVFMRRQRAFSDKHIKQRVGFEVPDSCPFDAALAWNGVNWVATTLHLQVLDLLRFDPADSRGNADLIVFDYEFRRRRKLFSNVLKVAFEEAGRGSEPIAFRGGYFVGDEVVDGMSAFAWGLFNGRGHPFLSSRDDGARTKQALRTATNTRRLACFLGLLVVASAIWAWQTIWEDSPGLRWTGLIAIPVIWVVGLVAPVPSVGRKADLEGRSSPTLR